MSGGQAHGFTNGQNASLVIGQKDFTSGGRDISQSGLNDVAQALFDSAGNLWVSEWASSRVVEFRPPFATGMDASLVIGQPDFKTGLPATTQNGLFHPYEIAFHSSQNLWVSDSDNARVLEFKPPFSTGMSASLVIGQKNFTTNNRSLSQDGLSYPDGIAFDKSGNLWVFDDLRNRILGFKPPFSNGMSASLVIGQANFESKASYTTQNGLDFPGGEGGGLAIDPSGNLWVADYGNNRVLEFKPPFSSGMNAAVVIGQPDFVTSESSIGKAGLGTPLVSIDPSGNLWVVDHYNNRVLEFLPPFSSGMAASLVIGQPDFTTGKSAVSQNGFSEIDIPGFDSSGNLWVPDHNRVLEFSSTVVPEFPTASLAIIALVSLAVVAVIARRFTLRRTSL